MQFNKQVKACQIFGWELAIRGMRNPKNSWNLTDTILDYKGNLIELGPNDKRLMDALILGGSEHRKFLRMIHVQLELNLTRKIWSEFDTYKFVEKNSTSTMHKLLQKNTPITRDLFCETEFEEVEEVINTAVKNLEKLRLKYFETKNGVERNKILEAAKDALPESFLQLRIVDTNYEELFNIYKQRKNHRLSEWRQFCAWLEDNIPYFKELFIND